MTLKIYNTLTRKKEEFVPIQSGKVGMYVCGITPYDECHLGHARAAVVFDVVFRYLKYRGYEVAYVRNFTDVDDKIIKKANEAKVPCAEISEKYIRSYTEQMRALGVQDPTHEPKATEHIGEMIAHIQKLIDRDLAYVSGSDVFFEVRKFPSYGKLSQKKIDELESGARIDVDERKKDPLDFALWKGAKPGEPEWESPWGRGRPGWHIECSAMSAKYLGERFDIHGGGRDLSFPHHENEIAQSEGATGKTPFARYWIHNGFVNINSEKMSKSLGNFLSVRKILEDWDPEVVRYFLLSANYGSPIDYTPEAMSNAQDALSRFYEAVNRLNQSTKISAGNDALPSFRIDEVLEAPLDDDINTTQVIGKVFEYVRELNRFLDQGKLPSASSFGNFKKSFQRLTEVIGFFGQDPQAFLENQKKRGLSSSAVSQDDIQKLIIERREARKSKNFKRSDEIRDQLAAQGIVLKDNPDGTTGWEVKK